MNIEKIIEISTKPKPYSPGTAQMWTDEYISTQLLEVHLNQHVDLASRNTKTIDLTVDWILDKVSGKNLKILDLGCGPGLYTSKFAKKGHTVTGLDFSTNSIDYATEAAQKDSLDITYRRQDYFTLDEENKYDLIIMIFTDFGVLNPSQRQTLLANIHRALKPGGTFLFDVLNSNAPVKETGNRNWEMAAKGFWRPTPYIALNESFYYEKEDVALNQHLVLDEFENFESYRFWIHTFTHDQLNKLLDSAGFRAIDCYDKILPDSAFYTSDSITFCICKK